MLASLPFLISLRQGHEHSIGHLQGPHRAFGYSMTVSPLCSATATDMSAVSEAGGALTGSATHARATRKGLSCLLAKSRECPIN